MNTYSQRTLELNKEIEILAERLNYDTNMIWVDAESKIFEKYSLPSFMNWGDGFVQGDATDNEVFETKDKINSIDGDDEPAVSAEWDVENDTDIITDIYEYLDNELLNQVEIEILNVKKSNWIEFYKEDIRDFLKENYFTSGGQIGVDYSVWIDISSGKIWEETHGSSNWSFQYGDENRKRIVHIENYEESFQDFRDLIATESDRTIEENLSFDLPENWEELEYQERVAWAIENSSDGVNEYDKIQRDEAIDTIISLIEDDDYNYDY